MQSISVSADKTRVVDFRSRNADVSGIKGFVKECITINVPSFIIVGYV